MCLKFQVAMNLYSNDGRRGDMEGITRFRRWNGISSHEQLSQLFGFCRRFDQPDVFDDLKTFIGCIWVAASAFIEGQLRDEELVVIGRRCPPLTCDLLPSGNRRIGMYPPRDVSNDGCFDVDSIHRGILSRRTSISAGAYKSIYASFRRQNAPHEFTPNVLIWKHLALIPLGSKCVLCQRQNTHRRTHVGRHVSCQFSFLTFKKGAAGCKQKRHYKVSATTPAGGD